MAPAKDFTYESNLAIMWWKLSGVNIFYHGITGDYYSGQGFGVIGVVDSVEVALFSFCWLVCFAEPCLAFFFFFFLLTVVHPWSSIASLLGFLHSAVDSILITSSKLSFSFSNSKILKLALPNLNYRHDISLSFVVCCYAFLRELIASQIFWIYPVIRSSVGLLM